MPRPPRTVLVYADHVGASMGGVGVRAVELARALAEHGDVHLVAASHDGTDLGVEVSTFAPHRPVALAEAVAGATMVVAQPQWPTAMSMLRRSGARLVFDLYDPEVFGTLAHFADRGPALRRTMASYATDRLLAALRIGHHVACANERQRDLWIGALLASGGVAAGAHDDDPTLRWFLDVVRYGVPTAPPRRSGGPTLAARLNLPRDAEVVLWNGGIWSWLDAPTAVRAMAELARFRPSAHLVFMGASKAPPAVRAAAEARALAGALGLLGRTVHFHDAWVPYEERADWLLDAACAISTHHDRLETRFSSRTRLLDCFWAGLPVVATRGDELGDLVAGLGLGAAVPPGDAAGAAAGIAAVLDAGRGSFAAPLAEAAAARSWPAVSEPLVRWLRAGRSVGPARPLTLSQFPATGLRSAAYRLGARAAAASGRRPPTLD